MLQRRVRLVRLRVVKHRVAVGERAALGVLAGEADRDPFLQERRERKRLGVSPVDTSLGERLAAPFELAGELRVHVEVVGHREQEGVELRETIRSDPRDDRRSGVRPRDRLGRRQRLGEARTQLVVCSPEHLERRLEHGLGLALGDHPLLEESLRIDHADGGMLLDARRLERLRVRGLVLLVVSEPAKSRRDQPRRRGRTRPGRRARGGSPSTPPRGHRRSRE